MIFSKMHSNTAEFSFVLQKTPHCISTETKAMVKTEAKNVTEGFYVIGLGYVCIVFRLVLNLSVS